MEAFPVTIGGKPYTLPPLTLRFMPKVAPQVDRMLSADADKSSISYLAEIADAAMEIIATVLVPSFPGKTVEQLREQVEASFDWADRYAFVADVFAYLRAGKVIAPAPDASPGEASAPADGEPASDSTATGAS